MSFEDGFNLVVAIIGLASFIGLLIITGPIFTIAMLVFGLCVEYIPPVMANLLLPDFLLVFYSHFCLYGLCFLMR